MNDTEPTVSNRRQFMKRAAAGAVGLAAIGGEAVAAGPQLADRTVDLATAEAAFEAHAGELFDRLSKEGFLEGGVDALPTDRKVSVGALVDDPEGTAYFAFADRPDVVKAVKHVDGGVLKISVTPETGRAVAAFEPAGEDVRYRYDPGRRGVERTGVSASADCSCNEVICPYGGGLTEVCCEDGDCWTPSCC